MHFLLTCIYSQVGWPCRWKIECDKFKTSLIALLFDIFIGAGIAMDVTVFDVSMLCGSFDSFSILCRLIKCFRRLPAALNVWWHMPHGSTFFSAICFSWCSVNFSIVANAFFWHIVHSNGLSVTKRKENRHQATIRAGEKETNCTNQYALCRYAFSYFESIGIS